MGSLALVMLFNNKRGNFTLEKILLKDKNFHYENFKDYLECVL
jgi:hypothetical protein